MAKAKLKSVIGIVAEAPHHKQSLPQVIVDVAETNYRAGSMTTYGAMAEYLNDLMWECSARMDEKGLSFERKAQLRLQWDTLSRLKCDCVEAIHRKE